MGRTTNGFNRTPNGGNGTNGFFIPANSNMAVPTGGGPTGLALILVNPTANERFIEHSAAINPLCFSL